MRPEWRTDEVCEHEDRLAELGGKEQKGLEGRREGLFRGAGAKEVPQEQAQVVTERAGELAFWVVSRSWAEAWNGGDVLPMPTKRFTCNPS